MPSVAVTASSRAVGIIRPRPLGDRLPFQPRWEGHLAQPFQWLNVCAMDDGGRPEGQLGPATDLGAQLRLFVDALLARSWNN